MANKYMSQCGYKGCKRRIVSGGNCIADTEGEVFEVDLCAFHLRKLLPKDANIKED